MDHNLHTIHFEYKFTSDKAIFSNKKSRDVPAILAVDALFSIYINEKIYFQAELPILEFYKSLFRWKEKFTENNVPQFRYYTIEYDEYDDGAILSLVPFSNKARLKSIWAEVDNDYVFDLDYIITEFINLEQKLMDDIEAFYDIKLNEFITHIPYQSRP
ncbi:hypothetical protein [Paucisalibacillus globulus]|uniref:DUF7878 domain-containing protein n=1 Tax=Paucisalibacillus globulus TaxID=351095 RepID=UPI00041C9EB0|nr:hypothetical protein [Paucisalibacillus globulus]